MRSIKITYNKKTGDETLEAEGFQDNTCAKTIDRVHRKLYGDAQSEVVLDKPEMAIAPPEESTELNFNTL